MPVKAVHITVTQKGIFHSLAMRSARLLTQFNSSKSKNHHLVWIDKIVTIKYLNAGF